MTMPSSYLPICSICNKLVKLKSGKVDELGKAVHEGCHLLKVGLRRATTPSKAQRRSCPSGLVIYIARCLDDNIPDADILLSDQDEPHSLIEKRRSKLGAKAS